MENEKERGKRNSYSRCPLRAYLYGNLIPPHPWKGEVVSVFSKAVNIRESTYGSIISLVKDTMQMTEQAILLSSLPEIEASLISSSTSSLAGNQKKDAVTACSTAKGIHVGSIFIDTENASVWKGSFHETAARGTTLSVVHESEKALRRALQRSHKTEGLVGLVEGRGDFPRNRQDVSSDGNVWVRKARKVLRSAEEHREASQVTCINNAPEIDISELIGLGIGFTPSGDDFIAGACAAEDFLHVSFTKKNEGFVFPHIRRDILPEKAHRRTTYGGALLLDLAAQNSYSALLLEIIPQLFSPSAENNSKTEINPLVHTLETAERYGETSGVDSLTGAWWFLDFTLYRKRFVSFIV